MTTSTVKLRSLTIFFDDRHLLRILLSEHREVGTADVKQFGHDGRDAAKMRGARNAFERTRDEFLVDVGRVALRIHLRRDGGKNDVCACGFALGGVAFQFARIFAKIFAGGELGWVDEDRDDHGVGTFGGEADETEVALVERAHGGDEPDDLAFGAKILGESLHFENRCDSLHGSGQ